MRNGGAAETSGGVVALVSDLMFASRIAGAARAAGVAASTVSRADEVVRLARESRPAVVLVDLDHRRESPAELVRRLKGDAELEDVLVVGFVSHVNEAAIRAAREAGADRVMARSAFVRELPRLVRGEPGDRVGGSPDPEQLP